MATIVDALIVTLGLDAKGFKADSEAARSDLRKTSAEAGKASKESAAASREAEKQAKEQARVAAERAKAMAEQAKLVAEGYRRVRNEVLGLLAVFTAGRGLKDFLGDLIAGDAATGRLARNLGIATNDLSAWEGAVRLAGGSAEGLDASLSNISRGLANWNTLGDPAILKWLNQIGGQPGESALRTLERFFDYAEKNRNNPQLVNTVGQGLGLDQGTINAALQEGATGIRKLVDEQKRLGGATDASAEAARKLQQDITRLQLQAAELGRTLLRILVPALHDVMAELSAWAQSAEGQKAIKGFFDTIAAIDFKAIATGIGDFAHAANSAAEAVGGWKTATELLFALWLGPKFLRVLAAIGLLRGGAAASGILGWLGALILGAGGVAGAQGAPMVDDQGRQTGNWGGPGGQREFEDRARNRPGAQPGFRNWVDRLKDWWFGGGPAGARAPIPPAVGGDKQAQAMQYFMSQGWTRAQAAGIVANLVAESGLDPKRIGDNGLAFGSAQWHPDRQEDFRRWAGKDIRESTLLEQLAFKHFELTVGKERAAGDRLREAQTPEDSAAIVSRYDLRPADAEGEAARRASRARQIHDQRGLNSLSAIPGADVRIATTNNALMGARVSNVDNSSTQSSMDRSVNVGAITVHTQATDGRGVGSAVLDALKFATMANSGLN